MSTIVYPLRLYLWIWIHYLTYFLRRLTDNDISYPEIIKDLQLCNLDVTWKVECLPVCMPKRKWLAMLKDKFPTQTEIFSEMEIVSGIRELSEGILKYEGDMVSDMPFFLNGYYY